MLNIRSARPDDALAIATIRVESWRATYKGLMPQATLDAMRLDDTVERWRNVASGAGEGAGLVAENEDGILGYAWYGPARAPGYGFSGELYAIYFRPAAMAKGFGARLFAAVTDRLREAGHADMILWVFEKNLRARGFYERLGGGPVKGGRIVTDIDGAKLDEIAIGFDLRKTNP